MVDDYPTKSNKERKKPKHYKSQYIQVSICLVISIILLLFVAYKHYYLKQNYNELVSDSEKALEEVIFENTKLKEDVVIMKEKLETIKNVDDLLERDIKLYIKSHYRKVPKSIASEIASLTIKFGKQYHISPILLVGIMQVESGFNPMITGPNTKHGNARGLMQVMPEWVKKLNLKDIYELYDIDTNIESGCKVFNIHKEEVKGSISKTLFKYVNGSEKYVEDVYKAMGKFVSFRSTLDSNSINGDPVEEEQEKEDLEQNANKPAESSN